MMIQTIQNNLITALALAILLYGPITALAWERGPWRLLERIRDLTPAGGEADRLISCAICLSPSVVAVMVALLWALDGVQSGADVLALLLLTWGWLWVLIRMTRFGQA